MRVLLLSWCCGIAMAQAGQLAVPSAPARAAVQGELLEALAQLAVQGASAPAPIDALLARASAAATPALRYELYAHAQRCALAAGDLRGGLRVAAALAQDFAVARAQGDCLDAFHAKGAAPLQRIAGGWLELAAAALETDPAEFATALERADQLAAVDQPPGLAAAVAERGADLRARRAAFLRAAGDPSALPRYRAVYGGAWAEFAGAANSGDRLARAMPDKVRARATRDVPALLHAAERELSHARDELDPLAQRNLRRRALDLLAFVTRDALPSTFREPALPAAEAARALRIYERTADALARTSSGPTFTFTNPADLRRWSITEGEWRVVDGCLRGRSTGEATRATATLAFGEIACVTIRGGIRSADGHNFRIAVGECNALLNWEVADENHLYCGVMRQAVGPHVLTRGREHVLRLCQLDELVVLFVDGRAVLYQAGKLSGTVTVYPALGSEIFIRSIEVVGAVDLDHVVRGPMGQTR